MTGWLLDTNVLSELRRPKPEPKVLAFVASQPLDLLYVSAASLAEIRFGIELVSDANRRAELNDWLAHKLRPMFDERVLPDNGGYHAQVAAPGRRRPKGRPHLLTARPDHRRDRASSRSHRRDPRRQRLSKGARARTQSLARRGADKRLVNGLDWVRGMLARNPAKLVAVALANRTARIVWAVMTRGHGYRAEEIAGQAA